MKANHMWESAAVSSEDIIIGWNKKAKVQSLKNLRVPLKYVQSGQSKKYKLRQTDSRLDMHSHSMTNMTNADDSGFSFVRCFS